MRRLTSTEVGGLLLAGLLVVAGSIAVLNPREGVIGRQACDPVSGSPRGYLEYVTKGKSRFYGGLAILIGCGLLAIVFYPQE